MRKMIVCCLLLISQAAHADCSFSGESYPEGTVINGYVCGADGKWHGKDS